jgi:RNA polymerase sigma-70 factor (ECF subfamily)
MKDQRFEKLLTGHIPALRAYATALTDRRCDADDAVAETLGRAWRYADSFDGRGSFEGWLLRICRNSVIDARLRAKRIREAESAAGVRAVSANVTGSVELNDLIRRLPVAQREVVVLTAVLGYSYEETAELLDAPIGTIRSRLHRARAALTVLLGDDPLTDACESA